MQPDSQTIYPVWSHSQARLVVSQDEEDDPELINQLILSKKNITFKIRFRLFCILIFSSSLTGRTNLRGN